MYLHGIKVVHGMKKMFIKSNLNKWKIVTEFREEKKIDVNQVKELLENSLKEKPLAGIDKRIEFFNVSKVEGEVK